MRYTLLYIYTLAMLALVSCKDDASSIIETEQESGLVLSGINATIIGGDGLSSSQTTRAENGEDEIGLSDRLSYSNDYIGRKDFIENEKIVLTTFKRTQHTLTEYSYTNILYNSVSSAWSRQESIEGYDTHDRIYWSDNASPHTCIGFCTPYVWIYQNTDAAVTFKDAKWKKNGKTTNGSDIYEGAFTLTEETVNNEHRNVVDFTVRNEDIEDISTSNHNKIDRKGTKLQNEDLLLYHNLNQQADIGGMTATLGFRHALASLRIVIDIREFSATEKDRNTKIYDLELLDQPYKYKWTQEQVVYQLYKKGETGLKTDAIGWGVVNNMQVSDSPVTIKTWQPRPNGEGTGEDKTYTFYSLIVPGTQTSLKMRYKVDYAEGTSTVQTPHTYKANLNIPSDGIKFIPGYTTTVRVSLNHSGEPIYIGAEFIDWENVETPDQSELQKVSTFLDTHDVKKVTIAGETTATKEDATWLYLDQSNKVVDKNGNDGTTEEKAFVIKTARQLLSFAKEVNNGRNFNDQYVKLEADLFLQPNINEKTNNTNNWTILWPGIGTADNPFNGTFLGGNRIIKLLKGKPLFGNIGQDAHIDCLQLEDVIGDITGGGCLANVNKGILCGCQVLAKNNRTITLSTTSNSYAGFICGENQGTIIACDAQGDFKSTAQYTGGITGKNTGAIVASIAIGKISSTITSPTFGGITASNSSTDIHYCCFDKDKNNISDLGDKNITQIIGLSTTEMQKENIVKRYNETQNKYEEKKPSEYLTEIIGSSTIPESLTDEQKTNIAALPDNLNTAILKWSSKKDWANSKHFVESRYYTHHVGQYPRVH